MWNKRVINYNPYPVSSLVGKLLVMMTDDDQQVKDILTNDEELHYAHDDCVLQAIERLKKAKINNEKVLIAGDYDCDGITATTIMKYALDNYGICNGYYIPDRIKEGYGLSTKTVKLAYEKGYKVILTVDNGVKAFAALKEATALGIETIVTDHHQIEQTVPANIIVHPDYMAKEYRYFSGAGVALQIAYGLIGENISLVTLAGIAALADVMPALAQTRVLIKKALLYLKQGYVPAIQKLMIPNSKKDIAAINFTVIPKLNSIGRMSHLANVNQLVPYLLSTNVTLQTRIAKLISTINDERKKISNQKAKELEKQVQDDDIVLLYDPTLLEGICGLVAGRISNKLQKPVLVLTKNEQNIIKGSGRSRPDFNLFEALKEFPYYLAFGGHEQACGLSIQEDKLLDLKKYIANIKRNKKEIKGKDVLLVEKNDFTLSAIKELETLEPLPALWKEAFCLFENINDVVYQDFKTIKKYCFLFNNLPVEAILYNNKGISLKQDVHNFIGKLALNYFHGQTKIQLIIEDLW